MDKKYDVIIFILKYVFLRRPRVAISANIIKIVIMFIKISLKWQKIFLKIRNYVSKCNRYLYYFI